MQSMFLKYITIITPNLQTILYLVTVKDMPCLPSFPAHRSATNSFSALFLQKINFIMKNENLMTRILDRLQMAAYKIKFVLFNFLICCKHLLCSSTVFHCTLKQ